jgi:transposase InsO family protein
LARTIPLVGFPAGKEFRVKTTAPNQLWQSDASYYFVVGWGWYYSIAVVDDYSRFVLGSDLKPDMTGGSISDVVEQAVAFTGMRQVPVEDRTKLLSDHGSGYLARAFEEYLRMLSIRHLYCAPHHPQTNGKIDRFHETGLLACVIKREVKSGQFSRRRVGVALPPGLRNYKKDDVPR